jgi:hypothetical protein
VNAGAERLQRCRLLSPACCALDVAEIEYLERTEGEYSKREEKAWSGRVSGAHARFPSAVRSYCRGDETWRGRGCEADSGEGQVCLAIARVVRVPNLGTGAGRRRRA